MKSFFSVVLIFILLVPTSFAADFSLTPSLVISEEYTDNVFETSDSKRTDYVTRALPGIAFKYNAPLWDWDVAYNFDYRYYARHSRDDDNTHNLLGTGHIKIIDGALFLDVSDTYSRVSLDVTRDTTRDSLFVDQSDSNTYSASPYFVFHSGTKMTVRTGYRYTNVWYRNPEAIDRREHSGFIETAYELSPKLNLTGSYTYTHENSVNPYNRHAPNAGFRYEYGERSFIFGHGGYTWFKSKNGEASNNPFWNAGITKAFDTLSVSLNTGVQYPEDPLSGVTRETDYALSINKDLNRGNIGLLVSYSRFSGSDVDTENRYSAGITASYDLTPNLHGILSGNAEKYDHRTAGSYTRRISGNPGLTYTLPSDIALSLNYFIIDYYSPRIVADNYRVNRVILEVRKSF